MTFLPLDIDLIMEHLRESIPEFQEVAQAADYATVRSLADFQSPSAYLVLNEEKVEPELPTDREVRIGGRQMARSTFAVVLALRNSQDTFGQSALEDARPLIGSVREALIGWTSGLDKFREIRWRNAEVLDYNAGTLLWVEVFSTHRLIVGNYPSRLRKKP